jgi:hypothetical protein
VQTGSEGIFVEVEGSEWEKAKEVKEFEGDWLVVGIEWLSLGKKVA